MPPYTRNEAGLLRPQCAFLRVNPKFCVNSQRGNNRAEFNVRGSGFIRLPLVCSITPAGMDVKGDGKAAVHAWITLQSCRRPVHFFVMSIIARYSIFNRLSSVGNTDFALVTLRSWRLKPSMALVV